MTRYFFHLRTDRQLAEDEEGLELPDLDAAREEANASAREMLAEAIKMGHDEAPDAVLVFDDRGNQLYEIVLAALLPKSRN
jgi:uncharacterized protein DUF6894